MATRHELHQLTQQHHRTLARSHAFYLPHHSITCPSRFGPPSASTPRTHARPILPHPGGLNCNHPRQPRRCLRAPEGIAHTSTPFSSDSRQSVRPLPTRTTGPAPTHHLPDAPRASGDDDACNGASDEAASVAGGEQQCQLLVGQRVAARAANLWHDKGHIKPRNST